MEKIILDSAQQLQLAGVNRHVPVCDQSGTVLGFFLPPALYKKLAYKDVHVPFTEEQRRQFRQSGEPCSLAEFWQSRLAQISPGFVGFDLDHCIGPAGDHRCG